MANVYRCYDADDQLVYVGATYEMQQRAWGHKCATPWWHTVARVEVDDFDSLEAAFEAEAQLIHVHRPRYNRQGNPDWVMVYGRYVHIEDEVELVRR